MNISVREAEWADFSAIAAIHRESFPRQRDSEDWVKATLAAFPRILVYVLVEEISVSGYVFWAQKSGIRPAAVVELDQLAVRTTSRGRGLAELLLEQSLAFLQTKLSVNNQSLKSVLVSTRADNAAQRLYQKVLGATVVAEIEELYSATEVLMIGKPGERARSSG